MTQKNENQPIEQMSPAIKNTLLGVMLLRPEGATIPEIANKLGWKENSVRGAISTLAKKRPDFLLVRVKENGSSRYRLKLKDEAEPE